MCLNNAILFDEAANDEADRHSQMMREQREGWDGKRLATPTSQSEKPSQE